MPPLGFVSGENLLSPPFFFGTNNGQKPLVAIRGKVLPVERPSGAGHRLRAADRRSPGG